MADRSQRSERIKSAIVAVILIGFVAFWALWSIPSAQRPSLIAPSTTPSGTPTSGAHSR